MYFKVHLGMTKLKGFANLLGKMDRNILDLGLEV
jgi:hypothetical protein